MLFSYRARALARLACAVGVAASVPARAEADRSTDDKPPPPTVIVIARPMDDAKDTPATQESVSAAELRQTTALFNAEDSLRYLPSLTVRKRHIGDTQAPLATRTSGVGSSARSLIYADGVLLSALIGNNNSTASPRWGMVSPEEIERVDVLYGPFSAAYAGNSIGAVVNITTRLPDKPEASVRVATSLQDFDQYGSHGSYPAVEIAGSGGGRIGPLRLFASATTISSKSQPLAYATVSRPAAPASGGVPVEGAFADVNRSGAPIFVLGASGLEHQLQHNLTFKAALDLSPAASLTYRGGVFLNHTDADARTYLSGDTFAGAVNIDGYRVTIPASAFSNNVYRLTERHFSHALTLSAKIGAWDARATGAVYDFANDEQRLPSDTLPGARSGGPGSVIRLDGTGWKTLDAIASHAATSLGAHWDGVVLSSRRFATDDWRGEEEGALVQEARGRTRTGAVWAQQVVPLAPALDLTVGGRYEWWRADRGRNYSLSPALAVDQPELAANGLSPKLSLRWRAARHWSATLSAGQAYRFPTVQELYQAIATGPTITVPNPTLRPERARSAELAIERKDRRGSLRLSLFRERVHDALLSQSAPLVEGSTTLFNYVQNIDLDRTRGIEVAFDRRGVFDNRLELQGSVTLVDPEILRDPVFPAAEGKDIPQVPRRRATLLMTWHQTESASFTLAGRYASRSYGTIDNSDVVTHTYQGFEKYLVVDARASFGLGGGWEAAVGVENIGKRRYFLFHPFPQRSFTAELRYRL